MQVLFLYNICKRASQNYWLARFVFPPICINFALNCNKPLLNAIYTQVSDLDFEVEFIA